MTILSSKDNSNIKNAVKLRKSAKYRRESGLFIAEGVRICMDAMLSKAHIDTFFASEKASEKYADDFSNLQKYSDKTIWCYSGYLFDKELLSDSRARCECTDEMLSMIDVLVDGEFVEALHDISLAFRGSSNQRIIDVKASLKENKIIPHKLMKRGV